MPKIVVSKITVHEQIVEVPRACPSCAADLTLDGALDQWDLVDVCFARQARLRRPHETDADARPDDARGDALLFNTLGYEAGETFIDGYAFHCARCGAVLAVGGIAADTDTKEP